MTARRRPRSSSSVAPGSVVYSAVLAGTLVALVLIAAGLWRVGVGLCGAAFAVGGLARAFLDDDAAGLLRVRRRAFDVAWMLALGVALVVLAIIVPPGV